MTTIAAKVIAASARANDPTKKIWSMFTRYPRFIHSELMTHRAFSRNAASSRAIPIERMIASILEEPAMPIHWGAAQAGMQAHNKCSASVSVSRYLGDDVINAEISREDAWLEAMQRAISIARGFANAGYHKQVANRLLEPFMHISVLITSTQWDNFFALRDHTDAEPHIAMLARAIKTAMAEHDATRMLFPGEWHLPYVTDEERVLYTNAFARKVSVARCASLSYHTVDGLPMNADRASVLFEKLVGSVPIHASPAEHQATPTITPQHDLGGNLGRDWIQFRKLIEMGAHDIPEYKGKPYGIGYSTGSKPNPTTLKAL